MTCQELARDAVIVAGLIGGAVGFALGLALLWAEKRKPYPPVVLRALDAYAAKQSEDRRALVAKLEGALRKVRS